MLSAPSSLCQEVLAAGNAGMGHFIGRQDPFHGGGRDEFLFQDDFPYRLAGGVGFFGGGSALFVADMGQEGRDDADAVVYPVLALFFIRFQAFQQFFIECVHSVCEETEGIENVVGNDRFHDVQFQLAVLAGQADGGIVADDLVAGLVQHFRNHRVHLARHDGRTGLPGGQLDFIEAAAGAGSHEADVVGHLDEGEGCHLQGRRDFGVAVGAVRGVHQVRRRFEMVAREVGERIGEEADVFRFRIEAGAYGGTAHVQVFQAPKGTGDAADGTAHHGTVGIHFFAQGNGHRILQVGAAHLDDVFEFFALGFEAFGQVDEGFIEDAGFVHEAHLDGGGEYIVRGLGHVAVVIGRNDIIPSPRVAENFQGPVAEDFIHIHVDGSAGTALDGIQRELVVHLSADYIIRCFHNGAADGLIHAAGFHIGEAGCFLHSSHGLNEIRIQVGTGNLEIFLSPHGLNSVIYIIRY